MQTSAKPVDQTTIDHIENQFYKALANFKSDTELKAFLSAFLSETEATVMCKRFAILKMLGDGKSYTTIEEELKVSSATVSSISKLTQEPAIAALLKELEADEWANDMSAKFMNKLSFFKKKEAKATDETPAEITAVKLEETNTPAEQAMPTDSEQTQTV